MATIESLNRSVTQMSRQQIFDHLHKIRAQRRLRPEKKIREAKAPAKVKRAPKQSAMRQQDVFLFSQGLDQDQKNKLAALLLKDLMGGK